MRAGTAECAALCTCSFFCRQCPCVGYGRPCSRLRAGHRDASYSLLWTTAMLATFAAIGPAAQGSVPDIMPLLQDESAAIRLAAADAIRKIQPPVPLSKDRLAEYVAWLGGLPARPAGCIGAYTARMALTHRTGLPNCARGLRRDGRPVGVGIPAGVGVHVLGEGILFLQRAIEAITGRAARSPRERAPICAVGPHRSTSFVWTEAIERDLASGHR